MSYGWLLEAVYASGFVLREQPEDINPYGEGNTFTAILKRHPESHHGPLQRLRLLPEEGEEGYEVDWSTVPPGAEPIVERRLQAQLVQADGAEVTTRCALTRFGYRWTGPDGIAHDEVVEF